MEALMSNTADILFIDWYDHTGHTIQEAMVGEFSAKRQSRLGVRQHIDQPHADYLYCCI